MTFTHKATRTALSKSKMSSIFYTNPSRARLTQKPALCALCPVTLSLSPANGHPPLAGIPLWRSLINALSLLPPPPPTRQRRLRDRYAHARLLRVVYVTRRAVTVAVPWLFCREREMHRGNSRRRALCHGAIFFKWDRGIMTGIMTTGNNVVCGFSGVSGCRVVWSYVRLRRCVEYWSGACEVYENAEFDTGLSAWFLHWVNKVRLDNFSVT